MARRRESVEPFLRAATTADDDYDCDDGDSATSPRPAELAGSTSTKLLPRLIALGAVSMLALLWGAFVLILRPSSSSSSSLAVQHHHHHTAQRSNATLQPVAVAAASGNWTVPLPTLPLTPEALRRSCDAAHNYHHGGHQHHDYYWADPTFVDPTAAAAAAAGGGGGGGADGRTLVYALAAASGSAQGLAESLLEVFSAYGLAAAEQRRFILDDRDWPWGGWEDYFLAPPPASSSSPPPGTGPAVPVEAVPCPRHAQAIVAAHTTRTYMFGHAFSEHFERPRFAGSRRQQRIFALVAAGYAHLFQLQPALEEDAQARVRALTARAGDGAWVAVHVRRGSLKPHTWAWHKSAIPLDVFVNAAVELIDSAAGQQPARQQRGRVVVVSDDRAVPDAPQLAGSFSPWNSNGRQGGGGGGTGMAGGYSPDQLLALPMADRVALGREFVVQLRVVAELLSRRNSSDPSSGEGASSQAGVVCAAGSATCRLLAIMLGWELSVEMERWKDIDGGLGWRGIDW